MANGMPISALVGLEKYMKRMPEIAYSGTFFGETLSIAASIATIKKLVRCDVPRYLNTMGGMLRSEINILLAKHQVSDIKIHGELELNRILFANKELQGKFIQEMARNGVLIIGSHNTCWATKKPELDRILSAWDATLLAITQGVALKGQIKGTNVRAGQINSNNRWLR
jgi:glutamate-1-semialdehyde 2,1-aminomutase